MSRWDRPPDRWRRLAGHLVAPDRREELAGDLLELWVTRRARGRLSAIAGFVRDVWSLARRRRLRTTRRPPAEDRRRPFTTGVDHMLQDLRFALRVARRQPLFSTLIVATIALGIGAATAIFTICHRVLIEPLPYPSPERLVAIDHPPFAFGARGMGVPRALQSSPAWSGLGLYATGGLNLGDERAPIRVRAAAMTSGGFIALGVQPLAGRVFEANDDRDAAKVVVLSSPLWRSLYAQDPGIVGRTIRLNGQSFEVIGVMPPGVKFPADSEVWIPVGADRQITGAAFAPSMFGRVAPGVSLAQAEDSLRRYDESRRPPGATDDLPGVTPLQSQLVQGTRPTLLFLAAVVGVLLVVACANVAGLLLSTLRLREREFSLRAALGARASRLVRQLLTECLTLTIAGAGLGGALAAWTVHIATATVPDLGAEIDLDRVDLTFLLIGIAVSAVTCLLFALGPVVSSSRRPAADMLRARGLPGRRARWFGQGLVAAQMAGTLVVLAATSAAVAGIVRLTRVDLGFDNDRAILFQLTLPFSRYVEASAVSSLVTQLETRLVSAGAARHVGATNVAPGSTQIGVGVSLARIGEAPSQTMNDPNRIGASLLSATPDYFRTMGIRMMGGRAFTTGDSAGSDKVILVSESLARRFAPEPAGAIGLQVHSNYRGLPGDLSIVGVVADVRLRGVSGPASSQLYVPLTQSYPSGNAGIVIDPMGAPDDVLGLARRTLRDLDPELPLYSVIRVGDVRAQYLATERLVVAVTSIFSGMALALCAIGLFGILAQLVAQRTREIGIRMALGADAARLRRSVVGSGLTVAAIGLAVGLAVIATAWHAMTTLTPSIDTPPPATVALDAVVLLLVVLAAAWIPARRASRVDPMAALRNE